MKLLHLSDLHIGKRVNEFSMLEDQDFMLQEILCVIEEETVEGVIIAGDLYDKSIPSSEAVSLMDDFLTRLSEKKIPVFIISGNHDSAERVSFGSRLFTECRIYVSPVFDGNVEPVILKDSYGELAFYMLPFLKPANVRARFPEEKIENTQDAVRVVIDHMKINKTRRNILIAHQFVTGAKVSEAGSVNVGGVDAIGSELFEAFDYAALGHIHKAQAIGRETVRYCGSPLRYAFSDEDPKEALLVNLEEKGKISFRKAPLQAKRQMKSIKGKYADLTSLNYYSGFDTEAYMHITLTDEQDIPDAIGKLRSIYPNIMLLDYDNERTRNSGQILLPELSHQKSPMELLEEFYQIQNNQLMNEEQKVLSENLMKKIWGEDA